MADGNSINQAGVHEVLERHERLGLLTTSVQSILNRMERDPKSKLCGIVHLFDQDFGFQLLPSGDKRCLTADIFLGQNKVARLCDLDPKAILGKFKTQALQLFYEANFFEETKPFDLPLCDNPNQPPMLRAYDYAALGAKDSTFQSGDIPEAQSGELVIAGMLQLYEDIVKAYEEQERKERELGEEKAETIQALNDQAAALTFATLALNNNPPA